MRNSVKGSPYILGATCQGRFMEGAPWPGKFSPRLQATEDPIGSARLLPGTRDSLTAARGTTPTISSLPAHCLPHVDVYTLSIVTYLLPGNCTQHCFSFFIFRRLLHHKISSPIITLGINALRYLRRDFIFSLHVDVHTLWTMIYLLPGNCTRHCFSF